MFVGRLLYQAGAYEASKAYYKMIPDESKKFLQARVEALWISMRQNDHSVILGELKTLEMDVFKDAFLPELYLVSSMANLQLCQFSPVEKAFKDFISNNKKYAAEIDKNLRSAEPVVMDKNDFYINQLTLGFNLRKTEKQKIEKLFKVQPLKVVTLNKQISQIKIVRNVEIKRSWRNREKILDSTLRKMRFVKVEFLSKMRRLQGQMAKTNEKDSVSTLTSALDKKDKLEFRYDGIVFGDELFHYTSKIKNLCLQGSK
jgi:ribosomal protein L23